MSVLQRKAQVGKREHQARAMTVPKALRMALAKVADERFDMALAVIGVTQEKSAGDNIASVFEKDALLLMLDGPDGRCGSAALEASFVTALVQQQTMGKVLNTPSPDRKMTATDAALCAPLLDALLERAHGLLESDEDKSVLPVFRFGARIEDERLLGLALDEAEYNVLRLTVDIAGGVTQATAVLILPVPEAKADPVNMTGDASAGLPRTLEKSVLGAHAELSAVLCRLNKSLSEISALEPGDSIPVPMEAFDAVEIVTIDGKDIGRGAMGQVDGKRALMLETDGLSRQAPGASTGDFDDMLEETSDYSNLNLPELELPKSQKLIDPMSLDTLPDLPDMDTLPDFEGETIEGAATLPDLPELPDLEPLADLPNMETAASDPPNLEDEATGLEDLKKLNIA